MYLSQEIATEKAKCLLHLYLCRTKARMQTSKIGQGEVIINLTKYDKNPAALYIYTERGDIQSEVDRMKQKGLLAEEISWPQDFAEKRFLGIAKPSTECTNASAPTSICGPRPALSMTGAVLLGNKCPTITEFVCRVAQLGDQQGNGS